MAALIIIISFFLLPNYVKVQSTGDNVFDITVNGQYVGCVSKVDKANKLLWRARKQLAKETDGMLLTTADLEASGREAYFVNFSTNQEVIRNMKEALLAADIEWFSYYDVRGEGKMRQARIYRGVMYDTSSIERILISIVVRDKNVEKTINAVRNAAYTGEIGDGRIFVIPVEDSVRIRTGERGDIALYNAEQEE